MGKALDTQVGGEHYKYFAIQPVEFCYKNTELSNLVLQNKSTKKLHF